MVRRLAPLLLTLLLLASAGCVQVYGGSPQTAADGGPAAAKAGGESAEKEDGKDEEKKGPFKPWDEVLEETEATEGFIKTHLKRDGTLYLELSPEELDRDFGMVTHYSRGLGAFNVQDGLPLGGSRLMRFRRVADRILLVERNPRFRADPGTPMATALEDNLGHSIAAAFEVVSEHEESKAVLVDATSFFLSDFTQVARRIKPYYDDKPVSFDKERSYVAERQGFPDNLELDVLLTYTASELPVQVSAGVSDYRSLPVGVRYSLYRLPDDPMPVRYGDDRVGYFLTAVEDFSRDREETGFVRFVHRWRLEKKDHAAAVSEPVEPIVYYIDHSVPEEYRPYVAEGIEGWNAAFEAAGFDNAIVARQAPDDPEWSAEDVRYSTVRWTPAHGMSYAIGPSQVDPRTGEILNADILIAANFVRGWLHEYQELADPAALVARYREMERTRASLSAEEAASFCQAAVGMAHQLAASQVLLAGLGVFGPGEEVPEEFIGDAIRDLVLHEVGHTLGLRHNFKASSGVPFDRLHDTGFTGRHGVTVSVMDYAATNIAADPDEQGHYWNEVPGSYDRWAIRYGYAPVYAQEPDGPFATTGTPVTGPEEELPALAKIARQAAEPLHTYGTDEDSWLGPYAPDPRIGAWDLGGDPIAFARERTALVERVLPNLEERLIEDGEGYQRLRTALGTLAFTRWVALLPVIRTVGGLHIARDHKGDPGERPPFAPLPAAAQRRALTLVAEEAFAPGAFVPSPELANKLAPNRWMHWGMEGFVVPLDFPVHQQVLSLQSFLLGDLLHPGRLARILDNQARTPAGTEPFRLAELFDTLTGTIWSELDALPAGGEIDSFRRNLQRAHIDRLVGLLFAGQAEGSSSEGPVPADARSLARLELTGLVEAIDATLDDGEPAVTTAAHLREARSRITQALEASVAVPAG